MFEFVNPVAVLGTTFFMMAAATLWYSEYMFQKIWLKGVGLSEADLIAASPKLTRNMTATFIAYGVTILMIAIIIGYAEVFGLAVQKIAMLLSIGLVAFIGALTIWEQRPLSYYLITAGFTSIFVLGSTFFLYHWPW